MAKYTTDEIVTQFKKKHGDLYDYSLVEYIHSQTKVKIICRIHGAFEQLPGMHRKGQGCAECMYDGKRHNLPDVLKRFESVHGDKYDYSLVEYRNTDEKVKIVCRDHGFFEQTPWHHLEGNGCPKCIGRYKTQEEVIQGFFEIHGDKYDYSLMDFKLVTRKVEIVCKDHGVFRQSPQSHLTGKGCPKCGGTQKLTLAETISQFKEVHGDRYDYSLVSYTNVKTKINIICKTHGVFEQEVGSHKVGNGCPICAGNYNLSTEEVIEQFRAKHGDRYDYSNVIYISAFKQVEIICREHGSFMQIARGHKRGSGCPECAITIGHTKENYVKYCKDFAGGYCYLYLIECFDENELFYKVGISYQGANIRFDSKSKLPYEFKILNEVNGLVETVWDLEKQIHKLLSKYKYAPRKSFSGSTECFSKIPKKIRDLISELEKSKQQMLIT